MKSAKAKARSVSKAMKKAKSVSKASSSKVAKKPKKTSRRPQSKKERLLQQKQRNALQQQRVAHTFSHVIPLGSTCLAARHLENKGMRMGKCPFDWIFSTPYFVRHALIDNFRYYKDPSSGQGRNVGTHHKVYQLMQDTKTRGVVFPHHRLWPGSSSCSADRDSYRRAVQRFRRVLKLGARPLFVAMITLRTPAALKAARDESWSPTGRGRCPLPEQGGPELCSRAEILRLFEVLQEKCSGPFHLEVVYLVTPKVLKKVSKGRSLKISEVYCKGDNTGLVFREESDMLACHNILTECGYRRFKLVDYESPIKKGDAQDDKQVSNRGSVTKIDFNRPESLKKKLQFVQKNPKVPGSSAHERYEKYKQAKTLREFLELGGRTGDFHNDRARGFVSLR